MSTPTLMPGTPTLSHSAVTAAVVGTTFAVPIRPNQGARSISWRTSIGGTSVAVNAKLQGAMNDVDAQYADLDTSASLTGEYRTVNNLLIRFIRVNLITLTAGAAPTFTSEILI